MAVRFSFEEVGDSYFGRVFRPIARVSFKSFIEDKWTETWMIVDTGADFTILPRYFAKELHVSLEKDCLKDTTAGVGGKGKIYLCKKRVMVKLGGIERKIPLAFFDNNEVPALLGRLGFLETFNTEFTKTHKVVFKL